MSAVAKFVCAAFAAIACANIQAQSLGITGISFPRPAQQNGMEVVRSLKFFQCSNGPRCGDINVYVTVTSGGTKCEVETVDFIDLHPNHANQKIVWKLVNNSSALFDVEFLDAGVKETSKGDDLEDDNERESPGKFKNPNERSLKKKKKDRDFLTYDILLHYKKKGSGTWTPCVPFGPAIVNRG